MLKHSVHDFFLLLKFRSIWSETNITKSQAVIPLENKIHWNQSSTQAIPLYIPITAKLLNLFSTKSSSSWLKWERWADNLFIYTQHMSDKLSDLDERCYHEHFQSSELLFPTIHDQIHNLCLGTAGSHSSSTCMAPTSMRFVGVGTSRKGSICK